MIPLDTPVGTRVRFIGVRKGAPKSDYPIGSEGVITLVPSCSEDSKAMFWNVKYMRGIALPFQYEAYFPEELELVEIFTEDTEILL